MDLETLFNNQYKQCKRIRIDTQRNKQAILKDQTQSMHNFLEKASNDGLVDIPHRTYKHEGKEKQHGGKLQKGPDENLTQSSI